MKILKFSLQNAFVLCYNTLMDGTFTRRKNLILAWAITAFVFLSVVTTALGLTLSNKTQNSKQGLPDIKDCVLDFSETNTENAYLKQHAFGKYEFFYNKWIVTDGYKGEPDAIVSVPHRYKDTVLSGKRLTNKGYSSYRIFVKGLKVGTPVYFMNNNFVGGARGYINGELVFSYGTMVREGECVSNGEAEITKTFVVNSDEPLEVVFEISSCRQGGLTSPPRIVISTTELAPVAPYFTNNVGFITLGLITALFAFAFIINFGLPSYKQDYSFALVMLAMLVLTVFSIGVYWRLLAFMRLNTYNIIGEVNLIGNILLSWAIFYHYAKVGLIKNAKPWLIGLAATSATAIILFIALTGTAARVSAYILTTLQIAALVYPAAIDITEKPLRNAFYASFILSVTVFTLCTAFDLCDITIAGLERSISYVMLPAIICVIALYRGISVENSQKAITALKLEKERDRIKADALKAQIKPHFIFNCLSSVQAAYEKSKVLGDKTLSAFSRHLRANVDGTESELVPFSVELENILNYCELENLRREKPVELLLDCLDADFYLPPLSLQPFVENAFKYSGVDLITDGYVELIACTDENGSVVKINDNGKGFDPKAVKNTSVGLKNATERLRLLAGAKVTIESKINEGTKITILLPKEKK